VTAVSPFIEEVLKEIIAQDKIKKKRISGLRAVLPTAPMNAYAGICPMNIPHIPTFP
jgi:hypothetical protein